MTTIPGRWLAILWTASALLACTMLASAHETVSIRAPVALAIVSGILIAGWARIALRDAATRGERVARDAAEYVGLFAAISLVGAVASYPDAAQSAGFADPMLARVDAALHFSWIGWYEAVAAHPALQVAGAIVYQSIFVSPAILLGYYALSGRKAAARRFLLAFWIGAMLTLALYPHLVALGPARLSVARADPLYADQRAVSAGVDPGVAQPRARRGRRRRAARPGLRAELPYDLCGDLRRLRLARAGAALAAGRAQRRDAAGDAGRGHALSRRHDPRRDGRLDRGGGALLLPATIAVRGLVPLRALARVRS